MMMDLGLNHLTEEERDRILSVLQRDEDLKHREQERIRNLKVEVKRIRLKGVIKRGHDPAKTCARCRESFGWLFNKGAQCVQCQHKVCDKCRTTLIEDRTKWLCVLCYKQMELDAMSGQWFLQKFRKSKRHRKTNKVISGNDLVKASVYGKEHPIRNGSEAGRGRIQDDLRKAQSNNNSPKSIRSVGSGSVEESSDTQSTASTSPSRLRSEVHEMGFPKESDKQKLLDLIRSKAPAMKSSEPAEELHPPTVEVRKVSLSRYRSDSDSSSSSDPSSPQLSARTTESVFTHSDSIRSSIRSSSAFSTVSAVSSDGRITVVTESCVSDMDSMSLTSLPEVPNVDEARRSVTPEYMYDKEGKLFQSSDSVIENPAHRHPNTNVDSLNTDAIDGTVIIPQNKVTVQRVITRKQQDSMSSESEAEETTTEQITRVKFRRVSTVKGRSESRSPSPEGPRRSKMDEAGRDGKRKEATVIGRGGAVVAGGDLSPADTSSLTESDAGSSHPSGAAADSSSYLDSTPSVPSISVSHDKETYRSGDHKSDVASDVVVSGEDEENDNIDELFAALASPTHSIQNRSSLLSPFSGSRESIVSYYSDAGEGNYGNIPIAGDILFALEYNYKSGTLEVKIKQCRDLAPVDTKKKRSDPYVKAYLLPDKTKNGKRKTRVKKHTLSPVFEEILKYSITKSELETRTLWLTVWHSDMFGRNDFLGEVTVPLDYYSFDDHSPQWYKLQERNASPMSLLTYKGDLLLSLKYVTSDNTSGSKTRAGGKKRSNIGELHILLKEARNLTAVHANGSSDPFCKGYLLPDKTRTAKQKTPVMRRDCNPQWNHTFVFEDVTLDELRERSLELSVWDHDRFTSNDFLGGIRLNVGTGRCHGKDVEWMDAKGEEISVWQSMLDRPNCWIDASLMLRTNMTRRK